MSIRELSELLNIKGLRRVSPHTVVIEHKKGGAEPASGIVQKMWELLTGEKI